MEPAGKGPPLKPTPSLSHGIDYQGRLWGSSVKCSSGQWVKVENSSVSALDFALPGRGGVVVVKELDCNVLCNDLSSLPPIP